MTLEFDLKARDVVVTVGGPDLFEAIQASESISAELESEGSLGEHNGTQDIAG